MRGHILLVEDDPDTRDVVSLQLSRLGFTVRAVESPQEALEVLPNDQFDALLTDHEMPGMSGSELCTEVSSRYPELPTIIVTAHGRLEVAVAALQAGAFDFLTKPLEAELVARALDRAVRTSSLQAEVQALRETHGADGRFPEIIGKCTAMRRTRELLGQCAGADISVLITGETGTGKEVVARALHDHSARKGGPFLAINCAALPEHLLESELFGHVKGAFTDAQADRKGIFLQADGGTLFLDEIGDMPQPLQGKLLRALQERKVRPLGGQTELPFDVRVIAATHRDMREAIQDGRFRRDLYYRLNVIEIPLPPLRDRGQDILALGQRFLEQAAEKLGRDGEVRGLTPEVAARLLRHPWEGNVRELQNCMERAAVVAQNPEVRVDDLPEALREVPETVPPRPGDQRPPRPDEMPTLSEIEARHITRVLAATQGNKLRAAKILGIDRTTLYRKLERYGILDDPLGSSPGTSRKATAEAGP